MDSIKRPLVIIVSARSYFLLVPAVPAVPPSQQTLQLWPSGDLGRPFATFQRPIACLRGPEAGGHQFMTSTWPDQCVDTARTRRAARSNCARAQTRQCFVAMLHSWMPASPRQPQQLSASRRRAHLSDSYLLAAPACAASSSDIVLVRHSAAKQPCSRLAIVHSTGHHAAA